MRRLRIGPRLTLSFALVVLLTLIGSAVGLWQLMQVRQEVERLSQVDAEALAISRLNNSVLELKTDLQQVVDTRDPDLFAQAAIQARDLIMTDVERAIALFDRSPARSQEARYGPQLSQLADIANLSSQVDVMIDLAQTGDWPAVQSRLDNQVRDANQSTQDLVEEIEAVVDAERELARQNMEYAQQQAFRAILMTGLLTLLAAAGLGFVVARSIARPLARLGAGTQALARHDFDHQVVVSGGDELTQLSEVFNDAATQLAGLYTDLEDLVRRRSQELQQSTEELEYRYLQLETSLAVSQRLISILDLDQLLNQVVELIKERYDFYYVGVFMLDESGEYVTVRAGTGEAGRLLREQHLRLRVGEEGIIGWVAGHHRPARVDDVSEDERYVQLEAIPDTRSELALPLMMGDTTLGVLDIQSDQLNAFRLDDMPVWQALADQVAIAIQNANLYEGEKARRQLAETLYEVGRALTQTLELSEVLDLILEHLAEIVPYDRAAVMLRNREELEIVAARGFPPELDPLQIRVFIKQDDVFEEIYHTKQPLMIPDVLQRPDWHHVEGLPQARAWLGVPLNRFNNVIGMLSLTREIPDVYNDDQTRLAVTFAGQAAIALENARLYDKISRFTQQLEDMIRERTDALQEAYTRLEHLDRAKSDFIKIAAHELRTPLTVLRGYSRMLMSDPIIEDNPDHMQLVSGIHSGALRLHEIVNSMLEITKIDNRALELYPEPLSVLSLIQYVTREYADALAERTLVLTTEAMPKLPPIEADPEALPKVFHHLIGNAIKYTPDGGTITISGQPATNDSEGPTLEGIEIIISDTGVGIDPEFQELIFTKFYQTGELALHSTSKSKFMGAGPGLGLAIARGIVEAHRGKLWVESAGFDLETCPGSRFHLFLPLRHPKPKRSAVTRPAYEGELTKSLLS
jgi:signal transduction histidine kinase/CHASE3 domain sensor protein